MQDPQYDLVIVGGGIAGLTAKTKKCTRVILGSLEASFILDFLIRIAKKEASCKTWEIELVVIMILF